MTIERKVLLKALTGSHNYNLSTEGSDRDYKIFTQPTFEDLYKNYNYKKNIITDTVDKDIKDIRQLPSLLYKSNIAYTELLFSKDIEYDIELTSLLNLRDDIARINLTQMFNSTGGMYKERLKRIDKPSEGTQHLVDAYGYNTKEAMHTFRSINVLVRYESTGFTDFEGALRYDNEMRELLLGIKQNSKGTKEEFVRFVTDYHDTHFAPLKEKFYSHKPNDELKEQIDFTIMHLIGSKLSDDLQKQY